jgi:hypothetical protein
MGVSTFRTKNVGAIEILGTHVAPIVRSSALACTCLMDRADFVSSVFVAICRALALRLSGKRGNELEIRGFATARPVTHATNHIRKCSFIKEKTSWLRLTRQERHRQRRPHHGPSPTAARHVADGRLTWVFGSSTRALYFANCSAFVQKPIGPADNGRSGGCRLSL